MSAVRWGVLSTSNFAQRKVIPAMKQCEHGEMAAIASRSLDRAKAVEQHFGIAKAYIPALPIENAALSNPEYGSGAGEHLTLATPVQLAPHCAGHCSPFQKLI